MIFVVIYLALIATTVFAVRSGNRPERLGAIWLVVNAAIHWAVTTAMHDAAAVHVAIDGIYATGLLPLSFVYVSSWIGVQTFIAAAGFFLEAAYLLADKPIDYTFAATSNVLFVCGIVNLGIATWAARSARGRAARRSGSIVRTS